MGTTVPVDLRDPRVRGLVRDAPVGGILTTIYRDLVDAPQGKLAIVPLRLLILLPVDDALREDAEHLALGLLGVDPAPRTLVALVTQGGDERSHAPVIPEKLLPAEFAHQPGVRFVDLRGTMVAMGHPRTGVSAVGTGPTDRWAAGFIDEFADQLRATAVFDAVWAGVPDDRPALVGMRMVDLGTGRDRAIADVALRLAADLQADGEPALGQALPERWEVDPRLQAPQPPYPRSPAARNRVPRSVLQLCELDRASLFEALSRTPAEYERAADEAISMLESEPRRWGQLFRNALGGQSRADGPTIDSAGAAALDQAVGGIVFGDPVAMAAEREGEDLVTTIGRRLESAASQSGQGLSPVILMSWLREDADRATPVGPGMVADRLTDPGRDWMTLADEYRRMDRRPRYRLRAWLGAAYGRSLRGSTAAAPPVPSPTNRGQAGGRKKDSRAAAPSAAAEPAPPQPETGVAPERLPAWHLPSGLGWIAGTPPWRSRASRLLLLVVIALILVGVGLQAGADATGSYLVDVGELGIGTEPWRTIGWVIAIAAIAYLLLGLVAGHAIRLWADQFGFRRIPDLLMDLDAEARAFAVTDVARCAPRREGARVARAAADTLELGITLGAGTAKAFGEAVDPGPPTFEHVEAPLPPYRAPISAPGHSAVTDAAGIYRLYLHYVAALRRAFATSLVEAIHTQWPRVRGIYWADTAKLIATSAAAALQRRLEEIREAGIWHGDLANELAEEMWSDPMIRSAALAALEFSTDDPIAVLASPADQRLLDITEEGSIVVAIPPQLESLLEERIRASRAALVVGDRLETATVIRVFPFRPGLYTFTEQAVAAATVAVE